MQKTFNTETQGEPLSTADEANRLSSFASRASLLPLPERVRGNRQCNPRTVNKLTESSMT